MTSHVIKPLNLMPPPPSTIPDSTFKEDKIDIIQFGPYEIDTWYSSPYPQEYLTNSKIFICEYCLKYMKSGFGLGRHKEKCPMRHPPGDEIYRDGIISVFEVDGRKNKVFNI